MALNALTVSLEPEERSSSIEHHSQGPEACTYYSKPPNGTNNLNHRLVILSRGHVLLVEETLLDPNE